QLVGDEADFVVALFVLLVEEPTGDDNEVTNQAVFRVNAKNLQVSFFSVAHRDAFVQVKHGRGVYDPRNSFLGGFHVADGERIGRGVGDALGAAFILRVNKVRADPLNQVQNILLTCQSDCDNKDERSSADYHTESGQHETDFVAAERVESEAHDLAECELGREPTRHCSGNGHIS